MTVLQEHDETEWKIMAHKVSRFGPGTAEKIVALCDALLPIIVDQSHACGHRVGLEIDAAGGLANLPPPVTAIIFDFGSDEAS
jgi:hypothetical protein